MRQCEGARELRIAAPPPTPVGTAASTDDIQLSREAEARAHVRSLRQLTARLADHYRLLDLPRDATTDEIKKAYYRLAPKFHPDKYYGKRLGPFKTKIETIFASLTRAHDTLRYEKRRTAYDATLPPLRPGDRIGVASRRARPPARLGPCRGARQPARQGAGQPRAPEQPRPHQQPRPAPQRPASEPLSRAPREPGSSARASPGCVSRYARRSTHPVAQRQPLHPHG
ncbi:MAG: DnaJ domain-containing protein [Polyangiaceae bacterium]